MTARHGTVTFLMLARIPDGGLEAFECYEDVVVPLLAKYGGSLERRLRTIDDRVEAHLVTFQNDESFAAYRADPQRIVAAPLLQAAEATVELLQVRDVR